MRCAACSAENPEGAVTCTSCGAAMGAAPAPAQPAARPRRRLSWLAVIALLAAAIAPWPQALMVESGGKLLGKAAAADPMVLMYLEYGGYALFTLAIILSLIALGQVFGRQHRRGGALAAGALLLAVLGMAGSTYAPMFAGRTSDILSIAGGSTGRFMWQSSAILVGDAIFCEIVLLFVRTGARKPAAEAKQPEPAKTA